MAAPILIVQTAFLGDLLLTIPLIQRIRRDRPDSPLHLVCRKGFGLLFRQLRLVDEVYELDKNSKTHSAAEIRSRLQGHRFEKILIPHPSLRTVSLLRGVYSGGRVGFRSWWNFGFLSRRVSRGGEPEALRLLKLWAACEPSLQNPLSEWLQKDWARADSRGVLPLIPDELSCSRRDSLLALPQTTALASQTWAFFPGSVWKTKQWPEEKWLELAAKVVGQGKQIVWLGGPDEKDLCLRLSLAVPTSRSLAGATSLLETLTYLSRCEGVVSNDSGGQHLAAVAGVPVVSIFGPTTLDLGFRPWSTWSAVAEVAGLFCRPCGLHGHHRCPRGTLECQTGVTAQQVLRLMEAVTPKHHWNLVPKSLSH